MLERVFAIVPDCHASTGYYKSLWDKHFYQGIKDVVRGFHSPQEVEFDWARRPNAAKLHREHRLERDETSRKIAQQISTIHGKTGLDAVISYCFGWDLTPQLVTDTIARGIPWINFFCDSTHCFDQVKEIAAVSSLNWFPEHNAIENYQSLGRPWICKPYAYNPSFLPDLTALHPSFETSFVGLPVSSRITQLGLLGLWGCPVTIRGKGWVGAAVNPFEAGLRPGQRIKRAICERGKIEKILRRLLWPRVRRNAGPELNEDEFFDFVRKSMVLLGLNQGRDSEGRLASYLKFRDLEFPGYGCCYLTEQNVDIEKALEVGKDILTYRSMREASNIIKTLKRDPARAREIGRSGRKRVLGEHSWKARLGDLSKSL